MICCERTAKDSLKTDDAGDDLGSDVNVTLLIGVVVATASVGCISLPILLIGQASVDPYKVSNYILRES